MKSRGLIEATHPGYQARAETVISPVKSRGLIEASNSPNLSWKAASISPVKSRGLIEARFDLGAPDHNRHEISPVKSRGLIEAKRARAGLDPRNEDFPGEKPGPH